MTRLHSTVVVEYDLISMLEKETSLDTLNVPAPSSCYVLNLNLHFNTAILGWERIASATNLELVTNDQFLRKAKEIAPKVDHLAIGHEYKWIATDDNGDLWLYADKPHWDDVRGAWCDDGIRIPGQGLGENSLIKIGKE